ncbi:hypothetical protein AAMO2058_001200000 [Amorphochlora amoebiformis]
MPVCLPSLFIRGGKGVAFEAEIKPLDITELSKSLGLVGELTVVALDDKKDTWEAVKSILRTGIPIRLEGVRTLDDALAHLDSGVAKVVLPAKTWDDEEVVRMIGKYRDRFVAAFQASEEVKSIVDESKQIEKVSKYVSEVLITFDNVSGVEISGSPLSLKLKALNDQAKKFQVRVNVTGGIETVNQLVAIDKSGVRPQVGDALVTGKLEISQLVVPFIRTDRADNLFTTVVVDEMHVALGLVYSNKDSITEAMRKQAGIYHSRRRGLWHKGLSSGATQDLKQVILDCDRDAVRFVVRQNGVGFCHLNRYTCWDSDRGVGHLFRTLLNRKNNPVEGSYTNKLLNKTEMLNAKMLEEATEIIEAKEKDHVAGEAADVLYFASVICTRAGVYFLLSLPPL